MVEIGTPAHRFQDAQPRAFRERLHLERASAQPARLAPARFGNVEDVALNSGNVSENDHLRNLYSIVPSYELSRLERRIRRHFPQ